MTKKLVNQISGSEFTMWRTGKYDGLEGELELEGRNASLEWVVAVKLSEAVLLGAPEVRILEASQAGRHLLAGATLSILLDGETAVEGLPLLGKHVPVRMPAGKSHWLAAPSGPEDEDTSRGIFLVNGSIVEVRVRLPVAPSPAPRIAVRLGADLYGTS